MADRAQLPIFIPTFIREQQEHCRGEKRGKTRRNTCKRRLKFIISRSYRIPGIREFNRGSVIYRTVKLRVSALLYRENPVLYTHKLIHTIMNSTIFFRFTR